MQAHDWDPVCMYLPGTCKLRREVSFGSLDSHCQSSLSRSSAIILWRFR